MVSQFYIVVKENLGYTSVMRARRVRFTKSAIRDGHPRATKTLEGVTTFRRNEEGRYAKWEAIGEQRRRQQSLCADCKQRLEYEDAKFRDNTFREGVENAVVHKKCPVVSVAV